jgi:hypothetical protein
VIRHCNPLGKRVSQCCAPVNRLGECVHMTCGPS